MKREIQVNLNNSQQIQGYQVIADLYHAVFTGMVLTTVTRRSAREAAEMVFRVFRRQHLDKFLPGLEKLGLTDKPHAVAAAQYHYLSNHIGGVNVAYHYESERKAWIRYKPPRWAWAGTAICGIPGEVSQAMLRGWHAHNGVSLGNLRMGFVCTKQTMDGQAGLEGYYYEYDRVLEPAERLRFARGETAPEFERKSLPILDSASWSEERRLKASRNYAMDYLRTMLPEMVDYFGPLDASYLIGVTGTLIGMQFYNQTATALSIADSNAEAFAHYFIKLAQAQGDQIEAHWDQGEVVLQQTTWRLMRGLSNLHPAVFDGWNALWKGALSVHNPALHWQVTQRMDLGGDCFEWRIGRQQFSNAF